MITPEHKRCYRCGVPVIELVDPAKPLGGRYGCCPDCRLRVAAETAAREWRAKREGPGRKGEEQDFDGAACRRAVTTKSHEHKINR